MDVQNTDSGARPESMLERTVSADMAAIFSMSSLRSWYSSTTRSGMTFTTSPPEVTMP